jgi:cytidylate kinase
MTSPQNNTKTPFVITIDGLASSGKGTLATRLGSLYDIAVLDTGLLYRLVGLAAIRQGIADPVYEKDVVLIAREKMAHLSPDDLKHPDLRGPDAANGASIVAAMPLVRRELNQYQRDFAQCPPPLASGTPARGAILDGRDIGTVIWPDAPIKFFVTATPEVRAQRRVRYLSERGFPADYETILKDIKERDHRDTTRATAATIPAPDAHVLDTSDLTIEKVLGMARIIIDHYLHRL